MKNAIYPGSFDPFHDGHMEILSKALKIFDEVYVVVTNNKNKDNHFPLDERFKKVKEQLAHVERVRVFKNFDKLTADFAAELRTNFLIRGLRDTKDLTYEIEMADANRFINKDLETVFLVSNIENRKISSSLLKEIKKYKKES